MSARRETHPVGETVPAAGPGSSGPSRESKRTPSRDTIAGKSARDWLDDVLGLFPDAGLSLDAVRLVEPLEVPEPYRRLLVHQHHMTVTLERHHGCLLSLEALEARHEGDDYARRLILRAGESGPIVLAGVMRFWLQHVDAEIREEIVSRTKPLGRILIEHQVLRRIETVAFLKVDRRSPMGRIFEPISPPLDTRWTWGRIAVLFVNDEPAVELLEIVRPEPLESPETEI